jgi:hypothetical protein
MANICKIIACILFSIWFCSVSLIAFWVWESCSSFCIHHPGVVFVAVGVIGETILERHKKLKRFFATLLIVGLLLEMREAVIEDGKVLALQTRIEELRKQNDALEAKTNPRTITLKQIKAFMFLTEKLPKISVRVAIGEPRDETFNYAWQIRQMLNAAQYMTPNSDTNWAQGICEHPGMASFSGTIGSVAVWRDLWFAYNSSNALSQYRFLTETTNGFLRPIVPEDAIGDTNVVWASLVLCFNQIGITNIYVGNMPDMTTLGKMPNQVNPGQLEILVHQKLE